MHREPLSPCGDHTWRKQNEKTVWFGNARVEQELFRGKSKNNDDMSSKKWNKGEGEKKVILMCAANKKSFKSPMDCFLLTFFALSRFGEWLHESQ